MWLSFMMSVVKGVCASGEHHPWLDEHHSDIHGQCSQNRDARRSTGPFQNPTTGVHKLYTIPIVGWLNASWLLIASVQKKWGSSLVSFRIHPGKACMFVTQKLTNNRRFRIIGTSVEAVSNCNILTVKESCRCANVFDFGRDHCGGRCRCATIIGWLPHHRLLRLLGAS